MLQTIGWALFGVWVLFAVIVCIRWKKHFSGSCDEERMYRGNLICTIIAAASLAGSLLLITIDTSRQL